MKTKQTKKQILGNEKGFALVWVYIVAVFTLTILSGFHSLSINDIKAYSIDMTQIQASYLAEAGIDHALAELRTNINFTGAITGTTLTDLGSYNFSVDSDGFAYATGTVGDSQKTITVLIDTSQHIPQGVNGAVTSGNIFDTQGKLIVDGRNHLADGTLATGAQNISNSSFGISYYDSVSGDGIVQVGGFEIAPSFPWPSSVTQNMASPANNISLNAVFGYSETDMTLANMVQGTYNSEFDNSEFDNTPLIFYLNPGGDVTVDIGSSANPGKGIFIVSNATKDSVLTCNCHFTGLIVGDNIKFGEGSRVIGAVVSLAGATGYIYGPFDYAGDDDLPPPPAIPADILYSHDVLVTLYQITGAGYLPDPQITRWAADENGRNRIKHMLPGGEEN